MIEDAPLAGGGSTWGAEGAALAASLQNKSALVVVAAEPRIAGEVALGLGRVESQRRRVAIADLVGELPVLQRYVTGDDPHGISDSFNFGVSLNKIAYPVEGAGELFVMPSGSDAVRTEAIFRSARWRRLATGFREVGALLLIVAPAGADGLEELIASTDGAIAVGDVSLPESSVVAAHLTAPSPAVEPSPRRATKVQANRMAPSGADRRHAPRRSGVPRWAAIAAALLLAAGLASAGWYWFRPEAGPVAELIDSAAISRNEVAAGGSVEPQPADSADSAGMLAASTPDTTAAEPGSESFAPALVTNPADSANASAWGVEIVATNTQSGAIFKLIEEAGVLPAATYAPVSRGGERLWFYVVSGAYASRTGADSLLRALRANGTMARGAGQVRRLPYALLVQTDVSRENAPALVAAFVARELPVYALLQPDGSASLFAGAFASPEETGLLAAALRARSLEPKVVYRIGRTF